MDRSLVKRCFWVVGISFLMGVVDYLLGGEIGVRQLIQYFIIAVLIEFSNYCLYVYRKDHGEI